MSSRHLLVGRFGSKDTISIPHSSDETLTELPLVQGQKTLNFGIQAVLDDLEKLNVFPSEVGVDLLILASIVHAADTRLSRAKESQDSWTREIRLVVPVSNLKLWISVRDLLVTMLNFLTGDKWDVGFRERPSKFMRTVHNSALIPPNFDAVNLFSGGLDSLIGAIDSLEYGDRPLLVSHAGEGSTSDVQNSCFSALEDEYPSRSFQRLRYWYNTPKAIFKGIEGEDTTRGRSFLFLALGVCAGSGLQNQFRLRVPENGLIALNVPLDALRLGSLSTRTTHPFYMARWNNLIDGLGMNGTATNPYWNKTKGEMVAECKNQDLLQKVSSMSLSCSSPTKSRWLGRGVEHCGYCLPCIIRRAALLQGKNGIYDRTTYTLESLKNQTINTGNSEGKQIRSFQIAIARLVKDPSIAKMLIHKSGSLIDETNHLSELENVYRRGMQEVGNLLSSTHTKAD